MAMTPTGLRIIEFLMASEVAALADLPDWVLAVIAWDGEEENTDAETAVLLTYLRWGRPEVTLVLARDLLASYVADPERCEALGRRVRAFRLSCCLEQLKRSGHLKDYFIDDPFDPESEVAVTPTDEDRRFLESRPAAAEWRSYRRGRWGLH